MLSAGDFVRQACGSWGDLRQGAEPLTYIEHLFDCVSMIASYTIENGEVTYSTKLVLAIVWYMNKPVLCELNLCNVNPVWYEPVSFKFSYGHSLSRKNV